MDTRDIVLVTSVLAMFSLYSISNVPQRIMYDLTIDLDYIIPLIPVFIIPYCSYFLLLPLTALALMRVSFDCVRFFLITMLCILLLSHACFWCFPTQLTIRPEIVESDIFSYLTKLLYTFDNPYAACPSVHANLSTLCAIIWYRLNNGYSRFMIGWSVIIILSTIFMKQHFVLDVIAGIASAFFCYFFVACMEQCCPSFMKRPGR